MIKVLIICYYWPPAGGPGVQRWLKFVKYLNDYGVEPIVYVPQNANYPIIDESLLTQVPEGITILKNKILEPYNLAQIFSKKETKTISSGTIKEENKQSIIQRIMLYIRGNFFIPDARKFWVKPSVSYLTNYLANNPVDAIITTGPPHSLHLIGLSLKAKLKLPWLADFRDPWTTIHYHNKLKLSNKSQSQHKKLEFKVLNGADHIIVTSPKTKKDFEAITSSPVTVITNGHDDEQLPEIKLDKKFSLAHIGSLMADRNPKILWESLSELAQEIPGFKEDLKLKLAGKTSTCVIKAINQHGLGDALENLGYLSHDKAILEQVSSQILLLIEIDSENTKAIIPGKIFEYLNAKRPILGIGPRGADFFTVIKETQAGVYFDYSDKTGLKEYIKQQYAHYKSGTLYLTESKIDAYSRRNLTQQLATVIKNTLQ